jgi:cyclopropane fatty-acyl-phospholipid synthase-like methyltransferase
MNPPAWQYDETLHPGVDYGDPAQVAVYDRRHRKFRDYRKDAEAVVRLLDLQPGHSVVDMGCGTGAFALHAAPLCRMVYAVDVSEAMLEYCRRQAAGLGVNNIVFCRAGYLTYEHAAEPADAAVSIGVLHHLPDFWKYIGLVRIRRLLKPGGKFHLFDIVFPGGRQDLRKPIEEWVEGMKTNVGPEFAAEVETHVRQEYSTYDWILEGMLERAGFRIERVKQSGGFGTAYLCINPG